MSVPGPGVSGRAACGVRGRWKHHLASSRRPVLAWAARAWWGAQVRSGTAAMALLLVVLVALIGCKKSQRVSRPEDAGAGPATPREALSALAALSSDAGKRLPPVPSSSVSWPNLDNDPSDRLPPAPALSSAPSTGRLGKRGPWSVSSVLARVPGPVPATATAEHDQRMLLVRRVVRGCTHGSARGGRVQVVLGLRGDGRVQKVDATVSGGLPERVEQCVTGRLRRTLFPRPKQGPVVDSFFVLVRRGR